MNKILSLVIFSLWLPGFSLLAQVKQNDLSKDNKEFNQKKTSAIVSGSEGVVYDKSNLTSFSNQDKSALNTKRWNTKKSSLFNTKKSPFSLEDSSAFKSDRKYKSKRIKHSKKRFPMYRNSEKEASVHNFKTIREILEVDKYKNANRYGVPSKPTEEILREQVDKLSMQDINRYNFRENHAKEPGLKEQRAGAKLDKAVDKKVYISDD